MATLNGGATGYNSHDGSARGRIRYKGVADGYNEHSGDARGLVVVGRHVTQLGAQFDAERTVPINLTQAGAQFDVDRLVPSWLTQIGGEIDVDRLVPIDFTAGGIGLDVDRVVPAHLTTIAAQVDARLKRVRTMTMCWEFYVFNRAGVYLTYLDNAFDKSYLTQLWDVGGGSFKLPTSDPKATTTNIRVGNIVRVRYANVDIGAFLMENIATTYVDTGEGAARIISVSGRGLLASLQKALVYPTDVNDPTTSEREFLTVTKADLFLTLYAEFVARGGGIFTTAFTDTLDSDSVAWTDSVSLKYRAGQTMLDVLRQLQGFGFEVVARPDKTLDAYVSMGIDRSASVAFRYGQNVLACSTSVQGVDLANVVLGEGNQILEEDTDAASITTYGRQEAYLPVRNTADTDVLDDATDVFLGQFATPPNSIALQVAPFPDMPLTDYALGDTVRVVIPDDIDADYRILAIAIREGGGPCDLRVTLELNSVQAEYLARIQRAMNASIASVSPEQAAGSGLASTSTIADTFTINDIGGITITSPEEGDLLVYDADTSEWINLSPAEAGITGGRVLISEQTPTGGTVTFGSIPGTYRTLHLEWVARSDRASNTTEAVLCWFNNDTTTANYYRERLQGADTTASAGESENADLISVTAATAPSGAPSTGFLKIVDYAGTVFNKVANAFSGFRTAAATHNVYHTSMEWEVGTVAINRIDLVTANSSSFVTGSTFRLYGET